MATKKKGARRAGARKVAKKAVRRAVVRKAARKAVRRAAVRKRVKRAPNPAFMRPVMPDEALAAVVGGSGMPRTELTKKLWAYIKRNGLQDAKERRMINADDKLQRVFGGKRQVSMFEMTKLVNRHVK